MKKRILSLAVVMIFSIVSILGCFNVFADGTYTQRVALKSYQPPVKTLLFDDDFDDFSQDSEGTITRTVESDYNCSSLSVTTKKNAIVADAEGGKAIEINGNGNYMTLEKTLSCDKIFVSFDMYCASNATEATETTEATANTNKIGFTFNNKGSALLSSNTWGTGCTAGNLKFRGTQLKSLSNVPYGKWVNVSAQFERVLNSSGNGYDVKITKMFYDGEEISVSSIAANSTVDWWTKTSSFNFALKPEGSNAVAYDNLIIYEPQETAQSTIVSAPSYLPAPKTIVLDEDFEKSTLDSWSNLSSGYANGCYKMGNVKSLNDENGNKYPIFKSWAQPRTIHMGGLPDATKLVVSFKIKAPDNLAANQVYPAAFNTANKETLSSNSAFKIQYSVLTESSGVEDYANKYKVELVIVGMNNGTASDKYPQAVRFYAAKTDFTKFTFVLEKKLNSDGETYGAYLTELYLNDEKSGLWESNIAYPLRSNWFDNCSSSTNTLYMGNNGKEGWAFDDFLIYEPVAFGASDIEVSGDGTNAKITFNDNAADISSAAVTATAADGTVIVSDLTNSGKTVTAAFKTPLDSNKVYNISVTGVKNASGETAPAKSKTVGTGFASFSDIADATLTIRNGKNTVMEGKLILAAYDANGNLISVSTDTNVSVPVDITKSFTYTIPTIPEGKTAASGKFFVWDNLSDVTPLIQSVEFRLN